ncbi:response regulator [Pontibacter beigongshangensis]|uniref:response regulator n=1 Tax=Pontibacter beigongshangensis TaxID=2574733 RepID=UPI0016508C9D|nr:response regulator [Pontibacter beigongshangensis]
MTIQRAFIIDDDELSTYLTQFVLEEEKLADSIDCYVDAEKAFEDLVGPAVNDLPEVIFLDLNMPYMSGWAFLDALRPYEKKLEKKIKIYILSSSINPTDVARSERYRLVAGFLHKPLEIDEVSQIKASLGQNK